MLHHAGVYVHIWGEKSLGDTRTVVVHIHNLRAKIEPDPEHPRYLKQRFGEGHTFDPAGAAE